VNLALTICLTPGIRNRQLIPYVRQQIIDFWNNKTSNLSSANVPTPKISSIKTSSVVRPPLNTSTTHTLYSTSSYGTYKPKAQ